MRGGLRLLLVSLPNPVVGRFCPIELAGLGKRFEGSGPERVDIEDVVTPCYTLIVERKDRAARVKRAETIYESKLRDKLELKYAGQYVAIDPKSEDYFVGGSVREACHLGARKHPKEKFVCLRVGYPATRFVGSMYEADLDWLGGSAKIEVDSTEGNVALLGTALLFSCRVELEPSKNLLAINRSK